MIVGLLIYSIFNFGVYILASLTFLSGGLLFFDGWKIDRAKKSYFFRSLGFFLLAVVFGIYATFLQIQPVPVITEIIKSLAYGIILISFIKEPLLKKPLNFILFPSFTGFTSHFLFAPISSTILILISSILFVRSTKGYDKQLKITSFAFLLISISEILRTFFFWRNTSNVFLSNILAEHNVLWNIHIILLLIGVLILARWIWGYIRFRFEIELFTIIVSSVFFIFLLITSLFSFVLLKNIESNALSHLKTDSKTFLYVLERLQFQSLSSTKSLSSDTQFRNAVIQNNVEQMKRISNDYLISQGLTFLTVMNTKGEVIARAEDNDNIGDVLIDDPLVKIALSGKEMSTFISQDNHIKPEIYIKSAVPIKDLSSGQVMGVLMTGYIIDDAFLDGFKDTTGLEVSVFAGDKRAASTITSSDKNSRYIGTIESNRKIVEAILIKGKTFAGESSVFNEPYYSTYLPLISYGGNRIGMIFIGKPQTELMIMAQKTINVTLLGSFILMLLSIVPSLFISKYINEHLRA